MDTEADGLLDTITKFHVLGYKLVNGKQDEIPATDVERWKSFFQYHIDNKIPVVCHNIIDYDVPAIEMVLGIDLSDLMAIDTLQLSWYLNFNRKQHGLDSFNSDYGIKKPVVENWIDDDYEVYRHRVEQDVLINEALWKDFMERLIDMYTLVKDRVDRGLVGGTRVDPDEQIYIDQFVGTTSVDEWIDKIITFLMFKADMARVRAKTLWNVDVAKLQAGIEDLSTKVEEAKATLESVMPDVPKYIKRKKPTKPKKKDGTLSAAGERWNQAISWLNIEDEYGNKLALPVEGTKEELKVLSKYVDPNANSSDQLKSWLFSLGWKPETFNYVRDVEKFQAWVDGGFKKGQRPEDRKVPQLSKTGDDNTKVLCDSVLRLADKAQEVLQLDKYTTLNNRLNTLQGWKNNLIDGNKLQARVGKFTSTLRECHAGLVNIPSTASFYGEEMRGCLIAPEGYISCGSDLSSLEDRIKNHFLIAFDPEYVAEMNTEGYDPHIKCALTSGMITQHEFDEFMKGNILGDHVKDARRKGKSTNYASVYGSGPETLARTSGMSLQDAKQSIEGYWKLNWGVEAIAEEQCVIEDKEGNKWLINPINGFCYQLRKEKDRFSALCQGTGSFMFDMWVDKIFTLVEEMFGREYVSLNGAFHDEVIIPCRDNDKAKEVVDRLLKEAIKLVSDEYMLRIELGCDVQYGANYSEIH